MRVRSEECRFSPGSYLRQLEPCKETQPKQARSFHSHINFNAPSNVPLLCTRVCERTHVYLCTSKFVNCDFLFTETLIKDPIVSQHHHPARVPVGSAAHAPKGNKVFLSVDVFMLQTFISSSLTCEAITGWGYTTMKLQNSSIKQKLQKVWHHCHYLNKYCHGLYFCILIILS